MSLRIVAGETSRLCRSTRDLEPTGSFVETKSSTMARKTASFLSSSTQLTSLALLGPECQVYGRNRAPAQSSSICRSATIVRPVLALR